MSAAAGLPKGYLQGVDDALNDPQWEDRLRRFLESDRIIPMPDARGRIRSDEMYAPIHHFMDEVEWRSSVIIPLRAGGKTVGALNGYFLPLGEPGARDIEFLNAVASQASVAVENARLYSEAELTAREQEALASIAATLTYDRPLAEVLDVLAADVNRGAGASATSLIIFGETRADVTSGSHGLPPGYMDAQRLAAETAPEFWRDVMRTAELRIIPDAREMVRSHPAYGPLHRFADQVNWDTVVRMPFVNRDRVRGFLVIYLEGPAPSESRLRFFRAISDQIAVAVENARLFAAVQERTRQLSALYRADEELHRSLRLDDVIRALLQVVIETTGAYDVGLILWEPDAARPRLITARHNDDAWRTTAVIDSIARAGRERFGRLSGMTGVATVEDTLNDPRVAADRTSAIGIRSFMQLSIEVGDQLFGVLDAVWREPRSFNEDEKRLFASLAKRAAIAIENARCTSRPRGGRRWRSASGWPASCTTPSRRRSTASPSARRTARTLLDRDADAGEGRRWTTCSSSPRPGSPRCARSSSSCGRSRWRRRGWSRRWRSRRRSTRARHGIEVDAGPLRRAGRAAGGQGGALPHRAGGAAQRR